jgi:hypothetical protein
MVGQQPNIKREKPRFFSASAAPSSQKYFCEPFKHIRFPAEPLYSQESFLFRSATVLCSLKLLEFAPYCSRSLILDTKFTQARGWPVHVV